MVDNKPTINLTKNFIAHRRSKYKEIKFHFINNQVNKKKIILTFRKINDKVANIQTKPLKIEKIKKMRRILNLLNVKTLNQKGWLKCNSN